VRAGVQKYGAKLKQSGGDDPRSALIVLVDDFLCEYYAATDRVYPGNLMRLARKTLGGGGK